MRASHDCTTVARHSRECFTTVMRYSCKRLTIIFPTLAGSHETFARVSHDSRETFVRASHDCTTVARHSRECLTTVMRYSCKRLTTVVRHSCECLMTFVRILISFISRNSLFYVTYLSHYEDRENCLAMCLRTSVKGWRRVCDGFATHAMTWRRPGFAMIFVAQKSITCSKLWRTVRDEFVMHARTVRFHATFCNSSQRFGESIRKPIANSSHPSEIEALVIIDMETLG